MYAPTILRKEFFSTVIRLQNVTFTCCEGVKITEY